MKDNLLRGLEQRIDVLERKAGGADVGYAIVMDEIKELRHYLDKLCAAVQTIKGSQIRLTETSPLQQYYDQIMRMLHNFTTENPWKYHVTSGIDTIVFAEEGKEQKIKMTNLKGIAARYDSIVVDVLGWFPIEATVQQRIKTWLRFFAGKEDKIPAFKLDRNENQVRGIFYQENKGFVISAKGDVSVKDEDIINDACQQFIYELAEALFEYSPTGNLFAAEYKQIGLALANAIDRWFAGSERMVGLSRKLVEKDQRIEEAYCKQILV